MDKIEYIISETEEHFSGREIIIYGYCEYRPAGKA